MLPLRPGPYTWRASLYEGGGEELVDYIDCVPQMIVALNPVGHPRMNGPEFSNRPQELEDIGEGAADMMIVEGRTGAQQVQVVIDSSCTSSEESASSRGGREIGEL